ncbi:hypothetical protein [Paraclostridium bifermentans]|uniref:hypothetical protein n=1 Tax=Paraclostridium bifermentans TaxID=1490 RepID=UPI00359C20CF
MPKVRKHKAIHRSNNKKSRLCYFGYVDYLVLASTLAVAISEEVSSTDLSILSTFFAVLSDELALIESVKDCSESTDSDNDDSFVFPTPVPSTSSSRNKPKVKKIKKIKKQKKR